MLLRARLRWVAALGSCCLTVGCLFHRPGNTNPPVTPPVKDSPVKEEAPTPKEGFILSDYRVLPGPPVARLSSAVDPLAWNIKVDPPASSKREEATAPVPEPPWAPLYRRDLEKALLEARRLLDDYREAGRENLLDYLNWLATIDPGKLPRDRAIANLDRLRDLVKELKRRAAFQLGEVCFCRRIESFGQYERLAPKEGQTHCEFLAGSDGRPGERVQVYVEVRNFKSVFREGHFETRLSSRLEIFREGQRLTERPRVDMNLGTCTDSSLTRRQDYFLNFQFHVPPRMPRGLYTLRVTVTDKAMADDQQPNAASRSLDFGIITPGTRQVEAH
jgi:hypothetical protein